MEMYLLKSAACLGILFLFYKIILENTSLHTTKRFYLLGSLVVSFVIPFITFTEYIIITPSLAKEAFAPVTFVTEASAPAVASANYIPYIIAGIYGLGVLIFSIRFGRNMFRIFDKVRSNPSLKKHSIFHVLLGLPITPHSFFNYIFFSKNAYDSGEIPEEVIIHETAHVEQKHSWDIVFIEVLRIVFWFNPFLYLIKHSIKLNHEFLADRTVLNRGADTSRYQTILLDFSSTSSVPSMAHSINYSSSGLNKLFSKNSFGLVKKRFTVMKTHTSNRAAWFRVLIILPVLAALIYGFSSTKTIEKIDNTNVLASNDPIPTARSIDIQIEGDGSYIVEGFAATKNTLAETVGRLHKDLTPAIRNHMMNIHITHPKKPSREEVQFVYDALLDYGFYRLVAGNQEVVRGKGNTPMASENTTRQFSKDKATKTQLAIYHKLAKKYNAVPITERKIGWEDLKTLENIYRLMTDKQKESALSFPECLPKNQTSWEKEYAKEYNDGAKRNHKMSLVITINVSEVMINGRKTSLKNFAKDLDKATKDWEETDYTESYPSVLIASTPDSFLKKLDIEFKKTHFSKANGGMSLIPPKPPLPEAPGDMPPPPAPKVYKANTKNGQNVYVVDSIRVSDVPPPPPAPKVIKGINDGDENIPPPPPPPTSPLDEVIKMAKKNATFYYDGKQISSDRAIELVKKNKDLNIQISSTTSKNPTVKISTAPIQLKKKMTPKKVALEQTRRDLPKPTSGNVLSHLKVMNRHAATFYLNNSEISFKEALKIVRKDLRQGFTLDVSSDYDNNKTYIKGATNLVGILGK